MGWRNLLFENYPVQPDSLRGFLPDSMTLDTFRNRAWISVVPFRNVSLRPAGFPERFGVDLPELNLRTYVRHGKKRGIYFFSLDAQGMLSVIGARFFHRLPYYYARISLEQTNGAIHFESHRLHPKANSAEYRVRYQPTGQPRVATDGNLTEFLVERYRFYTVDRNNNLYTTEVEHEPWRIRDVICERKDNTLLEANGLKLPATDPVLFYGEGVDVRASGCRPA